MKPTLIARPRRGEKPRSGERGFTMALVALSLVAMIGMAALAIDVGTLYQAKAEAQRVADAAALTAARMISISGLTGDPSGSTSGSWADVCGGASPLATLAAKSVAQASQNLVSGVSIPSASISVFYGTGGNIATATDCSTLGSAFAINPTVTVAVTSKSLPIFFARVFSLLPNGNHSGITASATATAEVYNPSNSSSVAGSMIPVQPRCVKPWIVPNIDHGNSNAPFVLTTTGKINNPGVLQLAGTGAIGESFLVGADCVNAAADCEPPVSPVGHMAVNPPNWGTPPTGLPALLYIPALVTGTPGAVPSCSASTGYEAAIAGCDQTTVYACGNVGGATADLTINPGGSAGSTLTGAQCLTNSKSSSGDFLNTVVTPAFPFQIQAGSDNPLVKAGLVNSSDVITTSSSIVTLPIADFSNNVPLTAGNPAITIVGFLQVFIQSIDTTGNMNVIVLNVSGCSNNATKPPVSGTSPVPIRLITPP